jgi:fermentation-respiration switch protein FrsA (DUF1100 family)
MLFKKNFNAEFNWKRLMTWLILIPVLVYIGLGAIAYFFADRLIFQPQPSFDRDNDSILKLATPNGEKISAKFFENPNAEFTILFSHGNAEDIFGSDWFFKELSNAGFNVFAYDYRGYGTSEGMVSEKNSYEDAQTAYDYLTEKLKIPPEKIIIHGRSLGAAVSIDLASRKKCAGLIAESSFVSAFRVLTRYKIYPFDKFQNLDKIENVKCPALFIHGKNDEIIPFWHSEKLFSQANEPKFFLPLDEANHNNVFSVGGNGYLQTIKDFAGKLPK